MKKESFRDLADEIERLHVIITILYIFSMFVVFLYVKYRLYAAIFMASVWIIERVFRGCPLTIKENELRKRSEEKLKIKKFIPRYFEKHLQIYVPDLLAEIVLFIFFTISVIVIIKNFFNP